MEANKLFSILKKLGHGNSKHEELREYCAQEFNQVRVDQLTKLRPLMFNTFECKENHTYSADCSRAFISEH